MKILGTTKGRLTTTALSLFVFPFPFAGPGPFRDCLDAQEAGHSTSGMYLIKPDEADRPVQVWCEQDIDNGGWTVLQTRKDGSVNFFRNWENYKVLLFFSWVNSYLAQLEVPRNWIFFNVASKTTYSEKYKLLTGNYSITVT